MQNAYKSIDLTPAERAAVERLIGRTLQNDEAVEFVVYKSDELRREQEAAQRKHSVARILELAKGKTLGGATVRELIEEGRRF